MAAWLSDWLISWPWSPGNADLWLARHPIISETTPLLIPSQDLFLRDLEHESLPRDVSGSIFCCCNNTQGSVLCAERSLSDQGGWHRSGRKSCGEDYRERQGDAL